MRILLVVHGMPPRHAAGTEVYTMRLAEALASAGHEVAVVAGDDDPRRRPGDVRTEQRRLVRVTSIAVSRVVECAEDAWSSRDTKAGFTQELAAFRPDVVHFQHLQWMGFDLPRIAALRGIPVVMTLNDYSLICPRNGQLVRRDGSICAGPAPEACAACLEGYRFGLTPGERRAAAVLARLEKVVGPAPSRFARRVGLLLRRIRRNPAPARVLAPGETAGMLALVTSRASAVTVVLSNVDLLISPSEFLRAAFVNAGWPGGRFVVLGYGVDSQSQQPGAPRVGAPGPLRVGFFGTVTPLKGVDLLVDAVARLPAGLVSVDVFGRDDQRPEYVQPLRRRAAGLPVRFHGAFAPADAAGRLSELDVTVVPSRWVENQPLSILESLAHRVPVVTADLGGMRELITDGVNGRLFRAGDASSLAAVLEQLARDRASVAALRTGIRPPPDMITHQARIVDLYRSVSHGRG